MEQELKKHSFWKSLLKVIGIALATIIVLIVALIAYVVIAKPYGLDVTKLPQLMQKGKTTSGTTTQPTSQQASQITPAQEACAVSSLGQARVDAIKAGAPLTPMDYVQAGGCFQ